MKRKKHSHIASLFYKGKPVLEEGKEYCDSFDMLLPEDEECFKLVSINELIKPTINSRVDK